jgi:hypothetical protein
MDLKATWMVDKNIVWLKINIKDEILFLNIEIKTFRIDSNQLGLTC